MWDIAPVKIPFDQNDRQVNNQNSSVVMYNVNYFADWCGMNYESNFDAIDRTLINN